MKIVSNKKVRAIALAIGLGFIGLDAGAQSFVAPEDAWDRLVSQTLMNLNQRYEAFKGKQPKWNPVAEFSARNRVWKFANATGRLISEKRRGLEYCTAFLVGPDKILTSRHCVMESGRVARRAKIAFGYYKSNGGSVQEFSVDPKPLIQSKQLDFVLLQVHGSPGTRRNILQLANHMPSKNTAATIVHHPEGHPMLVSSNGCRINVVKRNLRNKIGHTCDTLSGSSGAPVISERGQVVALHYAGESKFKRRPINFAKPAYLILPMIQEHLSPSQTQTPTPPRQEPLNAGDLSIRKPTKTPDGFPILAREPAEGTLKSGTIVYVRNRCEGGNLLKIIGGSNRNSFGQRVQGGSRLLVCVPGTSDW